MPQRHEDFRNDFRVFVQKIGIVAAMVAVPEIKQMDGSFPDWSVGSYRQNSDIKSCENGTGREFLHQRGIRVWLVYQIKMD